MNKKQDSIASRKLVFAIAAGMTVWAVVIAWGVVRNQPELDLRKPLVIVGVIAAFLTCWFLLMRSRYFRV